MMTMMDQQNGNMILPARAREGIFETIDSLTYSTDFSDMSDEDNIQFYTGKSKLLVVRSIAESTEPCLVIVSEPTTNAAFHKEMNTFDRHGTNADYNGYGTL